MWKGKTFTRFTAGLFVAAAMTGCGGGDEGPGTADGDAAAPVSTPPTTAAPGTAAPGGDPTAAPTTSSSVGN